MIEYAKELDLNLPLGQSDIDSLLQKRDLKLKGYVFVSEYLSEAYIYIYMGKFSMKVP